MIVTCRICKQLFEGYKESWDCPHKPLPPAESKLPDPPKKTEPYLGVIIADHFGD